MVDLKNLGKNIRKERKRQLLTMERLAELSDITDNFLGKIERGEGMPSLQTIDKLACALGVSIDWLLGNNEYETEHQFIKSLLDVSNFTEKNRAKFIDFLCTNVKYFK